MEKKGKEFSYWKWDFKTDILFIVGFIIVVVTRIVKGSLSYKVESLGYVGIIGEFIAYVLLVYLFAFIPYQIISRISGKRKLAKAISIIIATVFYLLPILFPMKK